MGKRCNTCLAILGYEQVWSRTVHTFWGQGFSQICQSIKVTVSGTGSVATYNGVYNKQSSTINGYDWWVARNDVGVTVQILRRAVQHDVEPMFDGTKINRAGKRRVYERDQPMRASKRCNLRQITDLQERIRHRLNVDRTSGGTQRGTPAPRIIDIDHGMAHPQISENASHKLMRPTIEVTLNQHVSPRRKHGQQRR